MEALAISRNDTLSILPVLLVVTRSIHGFHVLIQELLSLVQCGFHRPSWLGIWYTISTTIILYTTFQDDSPSQQLLSFHRSFLLADSWHSAFIRFDWFPKLDNWHEWSSLGFQAVVTAQTISPDNRREWLHYDQANVMPLLLSTPWHPQGRYSILMFWPLPSSTLSQTRNWLNHTSIHMTVLMS